MIAGIILAGGRGRRLGGVDKASTRLGDKPLIEHVIERISPQVSGLVINAAGDPARFAKLELPVAADVVDGFAGPLAGLLTGLEWVQCHRPNVEWLISVAVDTPFLPGDLVDRLATAVGSDNADMACARSAGRCHPVIALWPVRLAQELRHALTVEDIRKIDRWTARYQLAQVDFAPVTISGQTFDPFFNVNRPDDLVAAEHFLGLMDS